MHMSLTMTSLAYSLLSYVATILSSTTRTTCKRKVLQWEPCTRAAPTVANLVMGEFEVKWVYTYNLQPILWVGYIDNIFLIWTHGVASLKRFIHHQLSPFQPEIHSWLVWTPNHGSRRTYKTQPRWDSHYRLVCQTHWYQHVSSLQFLPSPKPKGQWSI